MEDAFSVVYAGRLKPGTDPDTFALLFSRRFKMDTDKARRLAAAGKEIVLKKGLDRKTAEAYRKALDEIGMEVRIDGPPAEAEGLSLAPEYESEPKAESSADASPAAGPVCPKCGSHKVDEANDTCLDCGIVISKYRRIMSGEGGTTGPGAATQAQAEAETTVPESDKGIRTVDPYAAPTAQLATEEANELRDPVALPIGNGGGWIASGWRYFRSSPGAWIVVMILMFGINLAANFIPVVGPLAVNFLWPVFMGGLMLGCQAQDQGERFEIGHLFAGFSRNTGQLLLLGLFYLGMAVLIGLVMAMIVGSAFTMMDPEAMQGQDPDLMLDAMGGGTSILLMVLVVLALTIPMMMAAWFAPALIAIEGMSALAAMKMSFMGCLKNILPFLWYGLLATLLMVVGALPFGLGLLVVVPMLMASTYAAYREIYYGG